MDMAGYLGQRIDILEEHVKQMDSLILGMVQDNALISLACFLAALVFMTAMYFELYFRIREIHKRLDLLAVRSAREAPPNMPGREA